jgi:rhamnosyltransferase
MSDPKVLINIVLYNPDKNKVLELIRICSHYEQAKILLFENAPGMSSLEYIDSEKIILYKSEKNVGVAGAHYYACKMAEGENFDFVLFLDQDSLLSTAFINNMVSGFYHLQKLYPRLCATGPVWCDPRLYAWQQTEKLRNSLKNKLKFKLKIRLKKIIKWRREKLYNLLMQDHLLISSGMLIWVPTLKKIGYPNKEYFIDLVDIEWCLRALAKNYQVEILKTVQMQHTIGEFKTLKNSFIQYKNPMRYYYSIRNSFFLFREKQFPLSFRLFILISNIMEMKKIPFVPKSMESLRAAWRGIIDGIFKKPISIECRK